MTKLKKHSSKDPLSPRTSRKVENEVEMLKRENAELQAILLERPKVKAGTRRFCCFFGFLLAAGLFSVFSLKTAVNKELPSYVQPYADWLLTHPLVPRTALELASTVLKERVTSPGQILALKGASKKHPVVFVPGFTSSALELWRTDHDCAAHVSPRSRIYSGPAMSLLTTNIQCWLGHMSLNASTWKDRDGVKVRPTTGLSAADYFGFAMESLFLWGKIIRELGLLGYDENSMYMASYDWRLSLTDLEKRDFYFTKLKSQIELMRATNDQEKVVIVAHSMGSNVFYYFMQWASAGNGAPTPVGGIGRARAQGVASSWVEDNIASVVLVGNSLMGSPKVLNSMLTGNIREVLSLWAPARSILENVLTRFDFAAIFRSWGSMGLLMPVGGEAIWGNATWSPEGDDLGQMLTFAKPEEVKDAEREEVQTGDDRKALEEQCQIHEQRGGDRIPMAGRVEYILQQVETSGLSEERRKHFLGLNSSCVGLEPKAGSPLSVDGSHSLLREVAPHWGKLIDDNYDFSGPIENKFKPEKKAPTYQFSSWSAGQTSQTSWANPLDSPLPYAPSLTMYCLHGVGVPTDRAFVLKEDPDYNVNARTNSEEEINLADNINAKLDPKAILDVFDRLVTSDGNDAVESSTIAGLPSSFPTSPSWGGASLDQNGLPFMLDDTAEDPRSGLSNGIRTVDGDGTITAFALGFTCGKLWKDPRYNPGGASSVLREYAHLSMDSLDKEAGTKDDPLLTLQDMERKLSSATAVSCQGVSDGDHDMGACMSVDLDGDGVVDTHVWDTDGDGVFDAADTTGDGLPEPLYGIHSKANTKQTNPTSSSSSTPHPRRKVNNATIAAAVAAAAAAANGSDVNPDVVSSSSYWDDVVSILRDADLGAFGRGLGLAADHVNILGNNALVSDVLKIATGTASGDCAEETEEIRQPQEKGGARTWSSWFKNGGDKSAKHAKKKERRNPFQKQPAKNDKKETEIESKSMIEKQCMEHVADRVMSDALEAAAKVPL